MQILVSDIKIPERIRKDVGNLDSLVESFKRCGQITPITVTRDMTLVAGFRRVSAAKRLQWHTLDAIVVDGADAARLLEMELEENVYRKDFTPEELLAGYRQLEKLRHPNVAKRVGRFLSGLLSRCAFWRRKKKDGETAAPEAAAPEKALPPPAAEAAPANEDDSAYGV